MLSVAALQPRPATVMARADGGAGDTRDAVPPALDVEALYRRYGPMVIRRCRQLLRDDDEALDVTQEVFLRLVRHRRRLDDRHPSSLLNRIATNLSLNRIRARKRDRTVGGEGLLESIACAPDLDSRLRLGRLFDRHPESTRTMAVLRYLDGMTLEEVASECGLSVGGVRKRLERLRASLREMEAS
jgi:RNA polymerase sigma-70 factor (ECF subfamily)